MRKHGISRYAAVVSGNGHIIRNNPKKQEKKINKILGVMNATNRSV